MEEKYIIGRYDQEFGEGGFGIVSASSEEEAIAKFAQGIAIFHESFQDDLYQRTTNMSFAEQFWTDKDHRYFGGEGHLKPKRERFEENVQKFFGEHREFAQIYIEYFFNQDIPYEGSPEHRFSQEMLTYIWMKSRASEMEVFKLSEFEV